MEWLIVEELTYYILHISSKNCEMIKEGKELARLIIIIFLCYIHLSLYFMKTSE